MLTPSRTRTLSMRVGATISSSAACATAVENNAASTMQQQTSVRRIEASPLVFSDTSTSGPIPKFASFVRYPSFANFGIEDH